MTIRKNIRKIFEFRDTIVCIYIYIFIRTKLWSSLHACCGNLIVSGRGLFGGGRLFGRRRFSSGKCRSVSFCGSRVFWSRLCFPWPKIYERRFRGGEFTVRTVAVDRTTTPPSRQLFVITLRVSIHLGRFKAT